MSNNCLQVKIVVPGAPIAKGRPKFRRVGSFVQAYTPAKTHKAEAIIAKCFREQGPSKIPQYDSLALACEFYCPIPSSISKKKKLALDGQSCTKKPDIDNYVKLVCDALNGVAWIDDNAVCKLFAIKSYSSDPRTEIYIDYIKKT